MKKNVVIENGTVITPSEAIEKCVVVFEEIKSNTRAIEYASLQLMQKEKRE